MLIKILYKKWLAWIFCIIVSLLVWIILYFFQPFTSNEGALYLLSAISQGLAAIFALVFTITLVVTQMTRRYTTMGLIFNTKTIVLMTIFALGIILPLIILKTGTYYVNEPIAIATFCVLSLIPYLKDTNATLKFEVGVENLIYETYEAINLRQGAKASRSLNDLNALILEAINGLRIAKVRRILESLADLGLYAAECSLQQKVRGISVIIRQSGDILIMNKLENKSYLVLITHYIARIGAKSVSHNLEYAARNTAYDLACLQRYAKAQVLQGFNDIERHIREGREIVWKPWTNEEKESWKKFKNTYYRGAVKILKESRSYPDEYLDVGFIPDSSAYER